MGNRGYLCIMFLLLCAVIGLVSAKNLENTEISQRLDEIVRGSPQSVDLSEVTGQWYQIGIFHSTKNELVECRQLVLEPHATASYNENCGKIVDQSTKQNTQYELIRTSFGEFLVTHNKSEDNIDSLSVYGRNLNPMLIQYKFPVRLDNLLLKPCQKVYEDCTRKTRNIEEKCDKISRTARKADFNKLDYQGDFLDDYFTICTINDTDYIIYDDVLMPIESNSSDMNKETDAVIMNNVTKKQGKSEETSEGIKTGHTKESADENFELISSLQSDFNHESIKELKDEPHKHSSTSKVASSPCRNTEPKTFFENDCSKIGQDSKEKNIENITYNPSNNEIKVTTETDNEPTSNISYNITYNPSNNEIKVTSETENEPTSNVSYNIGKEKKLENITYSSSNNEIKVTNETDNEPTSDISYNLTPNGENSDFWNRIGDITKKLLPPAFEKINEVLTKNNLSNSLHPMNGSEHQPLTDRIQSLVKKAKASQDRTLKTDIPTESSTAVPDENKKIISSGNTKSENRDGYLQNIEAIMDEILPVTLVNSNDQYSTDNFKQIVLNHNNEEGSGNYVNPESDNFEGSGYYLLTQLSNSDKVNLQKYSTTADSSPSNTSNNTVFSTTTENFNEIITQGSTANQTTIHNNGNKTQDPSDTSITKLIEEVSAVQYNTSNTVEKGNNNITQTVMNFFEPNNSTTLLYDDLEEYIPTITETNIRNSESYVNNNILVNKTASSENNESNNNITQNVINFFEPNNSSTLLYDDLEEYISTTTETNISNNESYVNNNILINITASSENNESAMIRNITATDNHMDNTTLQNNQAESTSFMPPIMIIPTTIMIIMLKILIN